MIRSMTNIDMREKKLDKFEWRKKIIIEGNSKLMGDNKFCG